MPRRATRTERALIHSGIFVTCVARGLVYFNADNDNGAILGPLVLTDWGNYLWVFAIAWLLVAALAVVDGLRGSSSLAIPAFIGLMFIWGAFYGISWLVAGYLTHAWATGLLFIGVAVSWYGMYMWIRRLQGRVRGLQKKLDEITNTAVLSLTTPSRTGEQVAQEIENPDARMEGRE